MSCPEVNTLCGRLRGCEQKSIEGFYFCAFKGIPYAKPPFKELRFKDPVAAESWTGVRDASEYGPKAAQLDLMFNIISQSEDCLYLNVFVKSIDLNARRPVMVYIHGGGFIFGAGDDMFYGPDYLLKKDIVLVTINYRLGIFGFLNLEHELAPGNQGLKDQVMALQWVRDNIANFGGDPENVTIFGESAGGSSVHYLTLSSLAKGLFHKAISQSGVAISPWASKYGDPKKAAYQICEQLGKNTTDPKEIVEFLRTVDASKLIELQIKLSASEASKNLTPMFGPGVDNKSPKPFLPVPIEIAAENGAHVPYILGHTNFEGAIIAPIFGYDYEQQNKYFENYIPQRILDTLKSYNITPDDLKKLYFTDAKITEQNSEERINLVSDIYFTYGIHKVLKAQVARNSGPTYFYEFTFDQGPYSLGRLDQNHLKSKGATHMDELVSLFNMKIFEKYNKDLTKRSPAQRKVMEQMVEIWTNFAKTGIPISETSNLLPVRWLPVTDSTAIRHLHIGEELRMETMLNLEERFNFKKYSEP